jgi:LPS export ABC transporter permease LptG/LPS export ABC transporter permease LptF
MRLLGRTIFREVFTSALLATILLTFVLFLQRARPLFEFLVRKTESSSVVAYMFALVLPQALPFTVPLGVVFAVLITMSRMSSDGEITAMRAAGVPGHRLLGPAISYGVFAMALTSAASLWLTPWSIRERYRIENQLIQSGLTADVQPRVFEEQFPGKILYVTDVTTGAVGYWKKVLLADITPPDGRGSGAVDRGDAPLLTLASGAVVLADLSLNRLQLSLRNGSTYEVGKENTDYRITTFPAGDQGMQARRREEVRSAKAVAETDTMPLYHQAYRNPALSASQKLDARIELHQRFALPVACVLMAILGVPLGITRRRAGKSAALVLTLALALLYYTLQLSMFSLARQGTLSAEIATWLPDLFLALLALAMASRLERHGDRDLIGLLSSFISKPGARGATVLANASLQSQIRVLDRPKAFLTRFRLMPVVMDTYVLSSFLFYFVISLVGIVMMLHVFTFFELLSDIITNRVPMSHVLTYHFFLTPRFVYDIAPYAVLTAVLAAFGVLAKNNEVTALKACGVSAYRLSMPLLLAGLLLSGSLFAFDHYWVPESDRRQDAIRAEIKGRPAQTFLRPDRKWIYGLQDRVYYYKYFDPVQQVMVGVNVYEIDPAQFRLRRHISAERAAWSMEKRAWVFQNGWSRDMNGTSVKNFDNFAGDSRMFPELVEQPEYFVKEVKQSRQMNFRELKSYVSELQQSGFDTVALQVQYHKKFSVPLFAAIMAMISIPFAFLAGNRGAMTGVGVSIAIAIAYAGIDRLFEQFGNLSQLPAQVAAWSPDAVFSLVGLYFFARMRT